MSNEWISVKDRLPTAEEMRRGHGYVIVAFESGDVRRGWLSLSKKTWSHETPQNRVTHWMPFPEPPKEEEG